MDFIIEIFYFLSYYDSKLVAINIDYIPIKVSNNKIKSLQSATALRKLKYWPYYILITAKTLIKELMSHFFLYQLNFNLLIFEKLY